MSYLQTSIDLYLLPRFTTYYWPRRGLLMKSGLYYEERKTDAGSSLHVRDVLHKKRQRSDPLPWSQHQLWTCVPLVRQAPRTCIATGLPHDSVLARNPRLCSCHSSAIPNSSTIRFASDILSISNVQAIKALIYIRGFIAYTPQRSHFYSVRSTFLHYGWATITYCELLAASIDSMIIVYLDLWSNRLLSFSVRNERITTNVYKFLN